MCLEYLHARHCAGCWAHQPSLSNNMFPIWERNEQEIAKMIVFDEYGMLQ